MEDTPTDAFRRLQELLEQMIRESIEQGNMARPVGFTIVIRGSGPFPLGFPPGQAGSGPETGGTREPRVEVHEGDDEVRVLAELPGISEDQVRLDVEEGALRISASDGARNFVGRASLPPVVPDSLSVSCRHGVLEVRFRRIPGPAGSPGTEGAGGVPGGRGPSGPSRERPGG
jgi:HSP20 family molecular chaperone IbpA